MSGLRPALSTFLFLLLITGGVYPLLTTVLGQWWFPWQANGSLIREGDTVRGSALIGQNFTGNGYFHGRPSATAEMPYNPQASGGSNLAVSNPELDKQIAARSEESDKIAALDAGADDYLSKPFGIGELQARLRVALRRHSATTAPDPLVKFSDVTVDLAARVIHRGEEEVHLTPIEFRLLAVLLNNAGKVLTQRQLLNQVWGPNAVEHSHYLRIYMGHLRQKLEQDPARPRHFITETGIGYRFML